jgi:hypothetical protein
MKKIFFYFSIIVFLIIFLCSFLYIGILEIYYNPSNGISQNFPFHNTQLKESFSYENYKNIEIGMNIRKVEILIGKPFEYYISPKYSTNIDDFYIAAKYSKEQNNFFYNFNWCMINLYYNKDSIVTKKSMSWFDD